jgi:hypothetical protein
MVKACRRTPNRRCLGKTAKKIKSDSFCWLVIQHLTSANVLRAGIFGEFALQGSAVHIERSCRARNIAVLCLQHALNMFPFQSINSGGQNFQR